MEIVSYVGFNESSSVFDQLKDNFDSLIRKFRRRNYGSARKERRAVKQQSYVEENSEKTVQSFDFAELLRKTGGLICYVQKNIKVAAVSAGILSLALASGTAFILTYNYFQTKAGPVSFAENYDSEMEMLDRLMNSFAMEENQEVAADGSVGNGENAIDIEKLFRQPVTFQTYRVQAGDTIGGITRKFGLSNISTLIAVNDIDNVRQLCAGQKLKIPSMDGLYYTVQKGNSLQGLSSKFGVTMEDLLDVNELESSVLSAGQVLFIPGAKLDSSKLQQAMGELFKCPITVKYRLTSHFGPRADPFTGARSNHTGVDMACPMGTPIVATASGKVTYSGVSPVFGNYVIINHGNGYQSLYGHMSLIIAKKGQWVSQGTRIGLVGSTGYSTGPHLHFTVYKNGKLVDPLALIK